MSSFTTCVENGGVVEANSEGQDICTIEGIQYANMYEEWDSSTSYDGFAGALPDTLPDGTPIDQEMWGRITDVLNLSNRIKSNITGSVSYGRELLREGSRPNLVTKAIIARDNPNATQE